MTGDVQLNTRNRPAQKRSAQTFDLILETAAEILEEVGFDKLNTNLICERAGLTPPALYRYFSNKYAVLEELGAQLMDVQNQALLEWLEGVSTAEVAADDIAQLLRGQYDVTRAQKGGKWIMRSLHSMPQLADVRLKSHKLMVGKITDIQLEQKPEADDARLVRRNRITIEAGYAILEMLIDNPDMDVDATLADTAQMISSLR